MAFKLQTSDLIASHLNELSITVRW